MSKWCQFSLTPRTVCLAAKVKCKSGNGNKNTNQFSESCNSFTSAALLRVLRCVCVMWPHVHVKVIVVRGGDNNNNSEKKHKKKKRQHKCVLSVQPQWQVWPAAMTSCAHTDDMRGGRRREVDGLRDSFSLQPS